MDPDHVFMSINPPNGLELSNLTRKTTIDELRERIIPVWPQGVKRQHRQGHDWHVTFTGRPWDSKGDSLLQAQRVICRVFSVLAAQGYMHLTSINTGCAFKNPRLVFVRVPADPRAYFFAMSFNRKGDIVTFVDPPPALINTLGLFIRAVFPRRIVNEQVLDDGTFTITLNPGINAMGPEKNYFFGAYSQVHQHDGIQN